MKLFTLIEIRRAWNREQRGDWKGMLFQLQEIANRRRARKGSHLRKKKK